MDYPGNIEKSTTNRVNNPVINGQFNMLVDNVITPIFVAQQGKYVYVNPPFEKFTGYSAVELYEMKFSWEIVDPEYQQLIKERPLILESEKERHPNREIKIINRDGEVRWMAYIEAVIDYGGIPAILGSGIDITARKQLEEELIRSEEKYRSIFENISEGIYQISPQGSFISLNPAIAKIFGFTSTEEMINSINDVQHQLCVNPEDREKLLGKLVDNDHYSFETEMYHKDGRKIWVFFNVQAVRNNYGELLYIEGTCSDISERKHSEELRQATQQQMEQVIELLPDATFVINKKGQVVFWNKAMEKMTGVFKEQIIGRGDYEYAIPFFGKRCPIMIDFALMSDSEYGEIKGKYDYIRKEGDTLFSEKYVPNAYLGKGAYLWGAASKLIDLNGNIVGAIQAIRDITEQKDLEKARAEEAAIQKMTLLSIGDGVISTNKQGKIYLFNKVSEQLTGWTKEEAFGKPLEEVFNIFNELTRERCINPVREVLKIGKTIELASHTVLLSKDGTERPIEDSAAPIKDEDGNINGVVLVFRDFTEKKERQEKIDYLSYHDYLTGLYNRRFYEEELSRLDTERNLPITLVMGDINGLKLTNDAFGHLVGDKLLKKVSEVMKKECRVDDIIARVGGDEFMLLLTNTNSEEAGIIVKRINKTLKREKIDSIIPSVSFGWATKYAANEVISKVAKLAEDNMYRRKLSESSSMRNRTIKVIIRTLYEKSKREEEHSQRVSELCAAIGLALDRSAEDISELRTVGLMHDIGKITLDETTLNKSGKLNDTEWLDIKRHSETGYRILSSVNEFSQIAEYVIAHHERWDGKGYPKGLKGDEIPLQARIMAIADAYDAMNCDRPYRKALSEDMIIAEIKKNAGKQFDPVIARVFVEKVLGIPWE